MVKITERKTKRDWAYFLEEIEAQQENADKITLVMDNLNTHVPGSLYETFTPPKAKALWDRFEFVYTPKHGSWLNMAEIELNVLTGQCLKRRMDNIDFVRKEHWHGRITETTKIQRLIGNSQQMMQGLSYHVFIRHLRIDWTLVGILLNRHKSVPNRYSKPTELDINFPFISPKFVIFCYNVLQFAR